MLYPTELRAEFSGGRAFEAPAKQWTLAALTLNAQDANHTVNHWRQDRRLHALKNELLPTKLQPVGIISWFGGNMRSREQLMHLQWVFPTRDRSHE
jgi:hypothetical protein